MYTSQFDILSIAYGLVRSWYVKLLCMANRATLAKTKIGTVSLIQVIRNRERHLAELVASSFTLSYLIPITEFITIFHFTMLRLLVLLASSSWFGMSMAETVKGSVTATKWGSANGQEIKKFTLRNGACQEVDVITYGATVTAIRTPDKEGNIADIVLGFGNIEGYQSSNNPYFGATIGRVANRIGKATFVVDGQRYNVSKNIGEDSLHGGTHGWSFKVWDATIDGNRVVMTLVSPDGDEGYPGSVTTTVSFQLNDDGALCIEMKAKSVRATPINLTNHGYFNLAGHTTNAAELYKHVFTLNADRWTVTNSGSIPTGEIRSVENSVMDLRNPTILGDVIDRVPSSGYDYNFCLPEPYDDRKTIFVAKVLHPATGRRLEVYSNQPGVQFYTSNSMPKRNETGIAGKNGVQYYRHAAFCLETQNYPDAVNHKNFPNSILRPGDIYSHIVVYKFGVEN